MIAKRIFVAGIGTGVGKTVVSSILAETLGADYWKPIQCGNLEASDSETVRSLISNSETIVHPEAFQLERALSPHAAAKEERREISLNEVQPPNTERSLIIEGVGGLLVPVNDNELVIDSLKRWEVEVVLVSRHYLGSINHTLLSLEALRARKLPVLGVIFVGNPTPPSEHFIREYAETPQLGHIDELDVINKGVVREYAERFRQVLHFLERWRER